MNGLLVSSEPVVAACTELSPLAAALPTQLMRTSLEIDHLGLSTTLVADREAAVPSANHSTLPTRVTFRQTEGAVLPHSLRCFGRNAPPEARRTQSVIPRRHSR